MRAPDVNAGFAFSATFLSLLFCVEAFACSSLSNCPTEIRAEPSTALARMAHSTIEASMSIDKVKQVLGVPTAVTLPGDEDPNSDFELSTPEELAVFWYGNGECGPVAVQFQIHEGRPEALVVGSTFLCVAEPGKTYPFQPPQTQRCDGGRKNHEYCR